MTGYGYFFDGSDAVGLEITRFGTVGRAYDPAEVRAGSGIYQFQVSFCRDRLPVCTENLIRT